MDIAPNDYYIKINNILSNIILEIYSFFEEKPNNPIIINCEDEDIDQYIQLHLDYFKNKYKNDSIQYIIFICLEFLIMDNNGFIREDLINNNELINKIITYIKNKDENNLSIILLNEIIYKITVEDLHPLIKEFQKKILPKNFHDIKEFFYFCLSLDINEEKCTQLIFDYFIKFIHNQFKNCQILIETSHINNLEVTQLIEILLTCINKLNKTYKLNDSFDLKFENNNIVISNNNSSSSSSSQNDKNKMEEIKVNFKQKKNIKKEKEENKNDEIEKPITKNENINNHIKKENNNINNNDNDNKYIKDNTKDNIINIKEKEENSINIIIKEGEYINKLEEKMLMFENITNEKINKLNNEIYQIKEENKILKEEKDKLNEKIINLENTTKSLSEQLKESNTTILQLKNELSKIKNI